MVGNPLKIKDLISELTRGGVCIPEIQRSYVWKRSQIARLLDSIYRSFPTGSILLWDTIQPIQMREMATNLGREIQPDFNPKIVLDGQQRLTSLGRVFDPATPKQDRIIFNVLDEIFEPLPKPERHRSGSASKPCVTVSKSHGSSTAWRLSHAPFVAVSFSDRLQVVAMAVE